MNSLFRKGGAGLLALILIGLTGCGLATMNQRQAGKDFIDANRGYMIKLRWSDYPGAAMAYRPDLREPFVERFRGLTNIRITDVQTLQASPDVEKGEAEVRYRMEFYRLNKATIKTYDWSQNWLMNEDGDWQLDEPFPEGFPPK